MNEKTLFHQRTSGNDVATVKFPTSLNRKVIDVGGKLLENTKRDGHL